MTLKELVEFLKSHPRVMYTIDRGSHCFDFPEINVKVHIYPFYKGEENKAEMYTGKIEVNRTEYEGRPAGWFNHIQYTINERFTTLNQLFES
jgi:hypothetical protein